MGRLERTWCWRHLYVPVVVAVVCWCTRLLALQKRGKVCVLACDYAGSTGGSNEACDEELRSDHGEWLDGCLSECRYTTKQTAEKLNKQVNWSRALCRERAPRVL